MINRRLKAAFTAAAMTAAVIPVVAACQDGEISWYGPGFNGKEAASGQIFNENAMTAAHRSLPFGTKVIVTNEENGRSVQVTINDRGPFHGGRIGDMSKAVAVKLGFKDQGTTMASMCPL